MALPSAAELVDPDAVVLSPADVGRPVSAVMSRALSQARTAAAGQGGDAAGLAEIGPGVYIHRCTHSHAWFILHELTLRASQGRCGGARRCSAG